MAPNGLFCADVPLRNYSLTPPKAIFGSSKVFIWLLTAYIGTCCINGYCFCNVVEKERWLAEGEEAQASS